MNREVVLQIDRVAPGMNRLMRMNKWDYRDLRDMWIQDVRAIHAQAGRPDVPVPCEITYMRSYKNDAQRMDMDNLAASFKVVGDALAPPRNHPASGWLIPDDSPGTIANLESRDFKVHPDEYPLTRIIFRRWWSPATDASR